MALLKNIPFKWGLQSTYWRVEEVQVDYQQKIANLRISGYSEKGELMSFEDQWFTITNERGEFDEYFSNKGDILLQQSYRAIKGHKDHTTEVKNGTSEEIDIPSVFADAENDEEV